jgi:hypothetical protein
MVFEDALVKLMEEIGCEGLEDVAVREIGPERCVNGSKAKFVEVGLGFCCRCRIVEARLMLF